MRGSGSSVGDSIRKESQGDIAPTRTFVTAFAPTQTRVYFLVRITPTRTRHSSLLALRLPHQAIGSPSLSLTAVPVNVEPVVPVSSTVRYVPIIDTSPGTITVLKSL